MSTRFIGGKGVNKDTPPSELEPGFWSDCLNFRTRNGMEEKFEGVTAQNTNSPILMTANTPDSAFLLTLGSDGAVYSNGVKAYAFYNGSHYDITRYRKPETISTLTRIAANTAEITTASAHGLTTGDSVRLFGAVETGYNTLSTGASITVMSATVFRYTTPSAIAANATTVGDYVVLSSSASSDHSSSQILPTGGVLNGIPFFYPGSAEGELVYWELNVLNRMKQVPFVIPAPMLVFRTFKDFLIGLTARAVYWSDSAEAGSIPTTMTAASGNDAGSVPMAETAGRLVDCLPFGDVNILYKEDSMYAMQYIGGNNVFRFYRLPGSDGLFQSHCAVNTPKGQVFLTQDLDVKIHNGGAATSIAEGRMRKYLASLITPGQRVFLCVNPEKSEVWVCFSVTGSIGCVRAAVWNWEDNAWGIFSLDTPIGVTGGVGIFVAATGEWNDVITTKTRLVLLNEDSDFLLVDSSATSGLTGTLERTGLDFGDRDQMKTIHRSRWNFDGTAGNSVTVNHGASQTADGTTSWSSNISYTLGTTDMGNGRSTYGRFVGVKLSTTANAISLRSYDLDVKAGGTR